MVPTRAYLLFRRDLMVPSSSMSSNLILIVLSSGRPVRVKPSILVWSTSATILIWSSSRSSPKSVIAAAPRTPRMKLNLLDLAVMMTIFLVWFTLFPCLSGLLRDTSRESRGLRSDETDWSAGSLYQGLISVKTMAVDGRVPLKKNP